MPSPPEEAHILLENLTKVRKMEKHPAAQGPEWYFFTASSTRLPKLDKWVEDGILETTVTPRGTGYRLSAPLAPGDSADGTRLGDHQGVGDH